MSEEGGLDFVILVFIAANCITLAMERPTIPPWSTERKILNVCNNLFTLVFTLEMAMKVERLMIEMEYLSVQAVGYCLIIGDQSYFSDNWNKMDGTLVIVGLVDSLGWNHHHQIFDKPELCMICSLSHCW